MQSRGLGSLPDPALPRSLSWPMRNEILQTDDEFSTIAALCTHPTIGSMQFAALRPAATRLARPPARPPASSRQSITPFSATQPAAAGQPGDKLLPLLRTPFDLLALPGRVALGTLQSLPEILEKL